MNLGSINMLKGAGTQSQRRDDKSLRMIQISRGLRPISLSRWSLIPWTSLFPWARRRPTPTPRISFWAKRLGQFQNVVCTKSNLGMIEEAAT